MKKILKKSSLISMTVAAMLFTAGCGGGGSDSNGGNNNTTSTNVTVVDPYIQDAVMYWDKNENGIYDEGEQVSTPTSKYGGCTFSPALPEGAQIAMKSKGIHNGIPFDGSLTAHLTGTGIVSPMTTLLDKFSGDTDAVVSLLNDAGIELNPEDLTKDPMANVDKDIKPIQASIAINTFLEIIGNDSDANSIESAKDKLKKSVEIVKEAIKPENIDSDKSADALINAAVTVVDYIAKKAKSGDTTILNDMNATFIDDLTTTLVAKYKNNPNQFFKIDPTKPLSEAKNAIVEAKSITAKQFFAFTGNKLSIEYSGGFNGTSNRDANGSDEYDPAYMWFDQITKNGNNISVKDIDFSWDDDDDDEDGNTNEHVVSIFNFNGTINGDLANGSYTGTTNEVEEDGTKFSGTSKGSSKTVGNVKIETFVDTEKYQDGHTETDIGADKEIFISAEKVTQIAGVPVGGSDRDVYKVKVKDQYGQMDGDTFVASGDGYNEDGWDCSSYANINEYVNDLIDHSTAHGGANSRLIFAKNGKFIDSRTGKIVNDVYWRIKGDVLQVRAYDDYDLRITENGECQDNWIGDMGWSFIGLTPEETNKILKVLIPNENLSVTQ